MSAGEQQAAAQDEHERSALFPTSPEAPTPHTDQHTLVQAPPMGATTFPTWDAFSVYFAGYQRETFQVYVNKTSTSVACRNQRLTTPPKYGNSTYIDERVLPAELKIYSRTLICTHGGKPRSRSQGIRPNQKRRPMECPAKINVLAKKRYDDDHSKASGWHIVVTQQNTTHNHPLNGESFMAHPRNRKLQDPMVLEAVNALRKAGVKPLKIRKYIEEKEPTKHVTRSDVRNLLTRMKIGNFTTNAEPETLAESSSGPSTPPPIESTRTDVAGTEQDSSVGDECTRELRVTGFSSKDSGEVRDIPAVPAAPDVVVVQDGANSIQGLCESRQRASGGFKLRLKRLEEQNLALYKQNSKLILQNRQYVSDLNQARKRTAEQGLQLMTLQRSEATWREAMSRLTQEITRVKAENATLAALSRDQSAPGFAVPETVNRSMGVLGANSRVQASKRALDSTGSNGTLESIRPQKRPSK